MNDQEVVNPAFLVCHFQCIVIILCTFTIGAETTKLNGKKPEDM